MANLVESAPLTLEDEGVKTTSGLIGGPKSLFVKVFDSLYGSFFFE